jgi:hypothetical protein
VYFSLLVLSQPVHIHYSFSTGLSEKFILSHSFLDIASNHFFMLNMVLIYKATVKKELMRKKLTALPLQIYNSTSSFHHSEPCSKTVYSKPCIPNQTSRVIHFKTPVSNHPFKSINPKLFTIPNHQSKPTIHSIPWIPNYPFRTIYFKPFIQNQLIKIVHSTPFFQII